jgi:predicted O-linked N-acetylglucosamine transferase (SPINDLY family)
LRGVALKALGRREEALAAFDAALARTPDDASAHSNRGELLRELGRIDEAAAAIAAALAADPVFPYAAGQLLHLRMHLADWTGHDRALAAVSAGVGTDTTLAFPLLALIDDPALHARAAARQIAAVCPVRAPALPPHPPGPKLRIGYFSSDFFWHATMFLLAEVLEAHDRIQVEVVLFSFGPDTGDPWRRRAEAAADRFIDVRMMADPEVAALARSLDIDIAVDLKGLTGDARPGIFAARAAPLQVNWLGYPGTMPAPFIDYLFADPHVAVPAEREHLAEAVIALPDSYQPNCRIAADPAAPPARADLGLPERGFVFCCFNQCYKITPERFAVWMRILAAVPGSVLWLWAEQETARANLRREAAARGIDPARLVFAALVPRDRHLARLPQADLFLDTGPYGAHTSGSDALRAGVPLLTVPGRSFASRVGASLLHAAGLPELVAADIKEYEARAISLARDPGALAGLRARLARRGATPLFAPDRFARNLEAAYRALDARARAGLPPADIAIPSDG